MGLTVQTEKESLAACRYKAYLLILIRSKMRVKL